MKNANDLIETLQNIVGQKYVLHQEAQTRRYRSGYRFGEGKALAVVRPGSLVEFWRVLKACVAADVIVITQAANTGLTGGSTPYGDDYDREIVIINAMRIKGIRLIRNNKQVVCLPASTLNELETLLKPLGREPHSVIGSSCIGASVIGGVCNNSGGALVQRGPAYTEMALYAQLNENGDLQLINHLGIALGEDAEEILQNLEWGRYNESNIHTDGHGHDHQYCQSVRQVDADTPARFNADSSRHYEASGSAGRLAVFAVRLDTFEAEKETAVFYVGTKNTAVLTRLRREMLTQLENLPVSGEYIHRDAYDMAAEYGKDMFYIIKHAGTHQLPRLFAMKAAVDRWAARFSFLPQHFSDKIMQQISKLLPSPLPDKMQAFRQQYDHHLVLKAAGSGVAEMRNYLQNLFAESENGAFFECDTQEAQAAMLHRFAVASAAVRYRAVHTDTVEDIVALDIALRRNDEDWFETLPDEIEQKISHKLYYGHFFCHVFHQDYVLKKGNDWQELEHEMLRLLDQRGAQYPAEHNVGHLYQAQPQLKAFYQKLDPSNSFNAGIGQTSKKKHWAE